MNATVTTAHHTGHTSGRVPAEGAEPVTYIQYLIQRSSQFSLSPLAIPGTCPVMIFLAQNPVLLNLLLLSWTLILI